MSFVKFILKAAKKREDKIVFFFLEYFNPISKLRLLHYQQRVYVFKVLSSSVWSVWLGSSR